MIIFIIGISNNETFLSSFLRFNKVDNFLFIVEFNNYRPFGLQTLSFHNLLKALFSSKMYPVVLTDCSSFLLIEFLCFSLIQPNDAILLAYFQSNSALTYWLAFVETSMLRPNTTKNISKIYGIVLIKSFPSPVLEMIEAIVQHKENNAFDSMMFLNLAMMKSQWSI